MTLLRIYLFAFAFLTILGLGNDVFLSFTFSYSENYTSLFHTLLHFISSIISFIACIGLYGYCFQKNMFKKSFWKFFARFFLIWSIMYSISSAFIQNSVETIGLLVGSIFTVLIYLALLSPIMIHLFKYANQSDKTISSSSSKQPIKKKSPKKKKRRS